VTGRKALEEQYRTFRGGVYVVRGWLKVFS